MRVIDTSIWIEIYLDSKLGRSCVSDLNDPAAIAVPTIVQHEIYKWLARERSDEEATKAVTFTTTCVVADLTTAIAIHAAELAKQHKLHTTDAIILATARLNDAVLLTCDSHFAGLEGVDYRLKES
ncbi:MAG: type II toxin-antitoxin system VapC family toxin [Aestuariivirga sp.]